MNTSDLKNAKNSFDILSKEIKFRLNQIYDGVEKGASRLSLEDIIQITYELFSGEFEVSKNFINKVHLALSTKYKREQQHEKEEAIAGYFLCKYMIREYSHDLRATENIIQRFIYTNFIDKSNESFNSTISTIQNYSDFQSKEKHLQFYSKNEVELFDSSKELLNSEKKLRELLP